MSEAILNTTSPIRNSGAANRYFQLILTDDLCQLSTNADAT